MKPANYTAVSALATVLLLAGCDSDLGFTGVEPGPSGSSAGFGGTGGGGTGGGGSGGGSGPLTEPALVHQLQAQTGLFDIKMSGDAQMLVFVSDQDINGSNPDEGEQIFAVSTAGGTPVQLTMAPESNFLLFGDWEITDNGDRVLFSSREDLTGDNPTLSHNLFLANTDGSGITQVTQNNSGGFYNEWELSGDGSLVVFSSEMDLVGTNAANNNQLFRINTDGTGLAQITTDLAFESSVTLAQDGSRIVYIAGGDPLGTNADQNQELLVINVDGSDHRQLTDTMGIGNFAKPEISDDGERIVFASREDLVGSNADGSYEVFTINADGTGLNQVSNSDRPSGTFADNPSAPGDYDISGNGAYIVFGSDFDYVGTNPNTNHTIFWTTYDGSSIGQPLREGTIAATTTSYRAQNAVLDNSGNVILFESTRNMSSDATGSDEKIYTAARD